MIPRYTRKEMAKIWEPESKFSKWLEIEISACEALENLGEIPSGVSKRIREKARFDIKRIDEIEKQTKHDVVAFLTNVAEYVGEESRFIHLGLTSSDILDTCLAMQLKEASQLLIDDLNGLLSVLKRIAMEHKYTAVIGRSHGIHAEPTTFGLKMALWYSETKRNLERMERAKEVVSYGMISGAVGTFANINPQVEEYVCKKLGLKPAPISTQVIQRDRHAEFMSALAIAASSLDKFATELRHLQRTEVLEAEEYFSEGQKGSSAMPHKRNPITAEQISGLARVIRGNSMAALENIPLWHERDISHSSVERVIFPDSTILLDYLLAKFRNLVDKLLIYPERMKENVMRTKGLIFSEAVLLSLARKGVLREDAYIMVQRNAMRAWKEGLDFKVLVLQDTDIKKHLTDKEIDVCFNVNHHIKNVDFIFKRVFGE